MTDNDIDEFIEQCQNLISGTYKISCKTGDGVDEMFQDIAITLAQMNRSRLALQTLADQQNSFKVEEPSPSESKCRC